MVVVEDEAMVVVEDKQSCGDANTIVIRSKDYISSCFFQKFFCHFLANFSDRPGICADRNAKRKNPGTIGKIRQKVATKIFEKTTTHRGLLLYAHDTIATPDE